jgi:hypothetical protein
MGEMLAKFWEQVERRLRLENSSMRAYDLILGSSNDRARQPDRLEEAIERL